MKSIIEKLAMHKRIRQGYGLAFVLLLISYLFTLYINRQLLKQVEWIYRANKTMLHLEKLMSHLTDGETGVRGFAVMRDPAFLAPYYTSASQVDSTMKLLAGETSETALQKERLDTLAALKNAEFRNLQQIVALLRESNFVITDSIRVSQRSGKALMDQIRSLVTRMQFREEARLKERLANMQKTFHTLNIIIGISLAIAFLLLAFGFLTYMQENRARRESDTAREEAYEKVQQYQDQLRMRIMELRHVNKELLEMRSIEKFAATGRIARTIAHEVRNPLTNINLAMEQLKSDMGDGEDNQLLFEMIQRNSNRINQLITDLLNSTKFSELKYNRVSINHILDEALELAGDRIALYDIQVLRKYSDDICEVEVDREKLKIAFLNIIVNAIEAMEPGRGKLTILTKSEGGKCVVEISDNGIGMDKESLGRLFEPYFTSKPKGNGLGLTNSQNVILNHKGTIHVESEPGKGTSFYIALDFAQT